MKASYNWLKDYLSFDLSPEDLGDILTDIGLEVEGMEQVESLKGGLKGVTCGKVLTCEKHPGADRLKLTTVDIGGSEPLQIVCGAPNVSDGQKVWIATVGTMIHLPDETSFEIKKSKVRGEYSEGMICAEDELGLGSDHDGIMVLDPAMEIGSLAADHYNVETDYVYEIGLTPNRSDAICHLGVADDLRAYLKVNKQSESEVIRPDLSTFEIDSDNDPVTVEVDNPSACPRYTGVTLTEVTIKESPAWLIKRLTSIGVKPINNVVDITNFVLHELGQPLHAFDLDKITGQGIIVKTLPDETKFVTLDGIERSLTQNDLMICDSESNPMCIGGVYGGLNSGVTEQTKSIFLEAAHFDAGWIRRTSTKHLLRTDAAKVFEKGSDPNITRTAIERAALLMQELAGAKISSEVVDIYPKVILPAIIQVAYSNVNRLIGVELTADEIGRIANALNMEIVSQDEEGFSIAIPTNKNDVRREADVIEEILRIYGYNNIPIRSKMHTTMSITMHPTLDEFRRGLGDFLAFTGFTEIMGLSLTQSDYYTDKLPITGLNSASGILVPVMNTSNVNIDVMRPDLFVTALETVQYNQNRQMLDMMLFEFGRSYHVEEDNFTELDHLMLTISGMTLPVSWNGGAAPSDFYTLKKYVGKILKRTGITRYAIEELSDDPIFQFGLSYKLGPLELVKFGKIKSKLIKDFDIRNDVWVADFNLAKLYEQSSKQTLNVRPLSKFPGVTRDLSIVVASGQSYQEVERIAKKSAPKQLISMDLFDIYADPDHLGPDKKSFAIRFEFQDDDKTLTDKDLDKFVKKILGALKHHLDAFLR